MTQVKQDTDRKGQKWDDSLLRKTRIASRLLNLLVPWHYSRGGPSDCHSCNGTVTRRAYVVRICWQLAPCNHTYTGPHRHVINSNRIAFLQLTACPLRSRVDSNSLYFLHKWTPYLHVYSRGKTPFVNCQLLFYTLYYVSLTQRDIYI